MAQKQSISLVLEPFEKKIILSQQKKSNLKIIPWNDLISFQKKKDQTMIHLTQNISFLFPIDYLEIQKKNLPKNLFYELRKNYTINLNHLQSIKFVQNGYYHCKLSDKRVVEINSNERTELLKYLEDKS